MLTPDKRGNSHDRNSNNDRGRSQGGQGIAISSGRHNSDSHIGMAHKRHASTDRERDARDNRKYEQTFEHLNFNDSTFDKFEERKGLLHGNNSSVISVPINLNSSISNEESLRLIHGGKAMGTCQMVPENNALSEYRNNTILVLGGSMR